MNELMNKQLKTKLKAIMKTRMEATMKARIEKRMNERKRKKERIDKRERKRKEGRKREGKKGRERRKERQKGREREVKTFTSLLLMEVPKNPRLAFLYKVVLARTRTCCSQYLSDASTLWSFVSEKRSSRFW